MIYQRLLSIPKGSFFLFGPRGTGKSTWLNAHFPNATYIDLLIEKTYQTYLANIEQFRLQLNALPNGSMVVVDEIQRLPNLLNEVHHFIEKKKLKFALSGSSARKLKRVGTNLLAGRAIKKELFPLLPEELGLDFELEKVLCHGSLPVIWAQGGEREVLESYVQTYLKEEIQAEALVRNLEGFARFLPVAALFHSQVINASSLARDAGVPRSSILGYLEILEDTLLGFRLRPFEGKLRVKEKKHPKLYWVDPGIARAAKKRFGELADEERGSIFEGWVASLLRSYQSYRKLFDDWNYWAPTESSALEVDFLLWNGNDCVAIEVKASKKFRPEFTKGITALHSAWKQGKLRRKMVVYLGEDRLKTPDGIEILPVKDFLKMVEHSALF